MRKIRVIQIGMGHDHAPIITDIINRSDLFEVVGIAIPDSDKEYLKKYNIFEKIMKHTVGLKEYTVEEILELPDIDAAFIETEEVSLVKYAQMAADKKLHIHMDKPGNANHDDFKKLVETAKKNKTVFHMGYMYRYNPAVVRTMERIKNGELGEIYAVEAHMDCHHPTWKRHWLKQFPGGMMFFLGCHLIDLIFRIQGMPEEIIPYNCATGIDGTTSEDYGMAVFKYKNGISFAKTCDTEPGGFMRRQLVVCGSKGTVRIMPLEVFLQNAETLVEWREIDCTGNPVWTDNGKEFVSGPYRRYDYMFEAFVKMVCGDIENPYTYDYEEKLHEVVLKACGISEV